MDIRSVCPYSFGANTYVVFSDIHALVIDPAVSVDAIVSAASDVGARIEGILLTHGHYDHTVSIDTLRRALSVPVYVHSADAVMLTDGRKNAFFDFFGKECVHAPADRLLEDGDTLTLGDESIRVLHTAGHSAGSVCFDCGSFIVTGDTLFAESIGRCDLWSGNEAQLRDSLKRLRGLEPSLTIYPGHGAPARLGDALDNAAYYI